MSEGKQKQVAVVGAAAYVGGPLLRLLKREGYKTVARVRPTTDTSSLIDLPDVVMRGDLGDFEFVEEATRGSVAIIDLVNQLNPPCKTLEEQLENDVPPLEACLHAGLAHGARVVYTSGNFSLPTRGRSGKIDETLVPKPPPEVIQGSFSSHWPTFCHIDEMDGVLLLAETKHRCEHLVNDFVQLHPRSRACTVIPAATYGAGLGGRVSFWDSVPTWYLAGYFKDFMTGFIHVEDLCRCYLAVVERGRAGGRYLAAGEPMRVSDFVRMYAAAAGAPIDGGQQRSVFANPRQLVYDDSATRRELGIEWERGLEESLAEHMRYLRQHGKLALEAPSPQPSA
jgi:nucleoside-diphosphate-sugar epimerase